MKRVVLLLAGAAMLLMVAGCNKEKTCRCTVTGTSTVRIIKIDKGECTQLGVYTYHTPLNATVTDSLLCTDYEFQIDSIYKD